MSKGSGDHTGDAGDGFEEDETDELFERCKFPVVCIMGRGEN